MEPFPEQCEPWMHSLLLSAPNLKLLRLPGCIPFKISHHPITYLELNFEWESELSILLNLSRCFTLESLKLT